MNIFTMLGVLFIGLKLAHIINWSWWLVTLPITGAFALWFVIVVLAAIGTATAGSR